MKRFESELSRVFKLFAASSGHIRHHVILGGQTGSGKTHTVRELAKGEGFKFMQINAAQLTKESNGGISLSRILEPLKYDYNQSKLTICLVDEWDKLFLASNSQSPSVCEAVLGVQNEFLTLLESDTYTVYDDYGHYIDVPVKHILFVFAGAFNDRESLDHGYLSRLGVKSELLGRISLVTCTDKVTLDDLFSCLNSSESFNMHLACFPSLKRDQAYADLSKMIEDNYISNRYGYRLVNQVINKYFMNVSDPIVDDAGFAPLFSGGWERIERTGNGITL